LSELNVYSGLEGETLYVIEGKDDNGDYGILATNNEVVGGDEGERAIGFLLMPHYEGAVKLRNMIAEDAPHFEARIVRFNRSQVFTF